jgi:hypothetical protein
VAATVAVAAPAAKPCTGAQLTGSFKAVPGSAGAGNISYTLVLRNRSHVTCTLAGRPSVRLLGSGGKQLPTTVRAPSPGSLAEPLVSLVPGGHTSAAARFSPDVPGIGEPTQGTRCEPVAHRLRVNPPGGGSTVVPITPPTPVCEHGRLTFGMYGVGR